MEYFVKLPYTAVKSNLIKQKKLVEEEISVKIILLTCKAGVYFSPFKMLFQKCLPLNIIFKFDCASYRRVQE